MTTEGLIARHCAHLAFLGRRPGTIEQRRWALGRLTCRGDLLHITPAELVHHLARPGRRADARATEVSHVRGFYDWAVDTGLLDVSPAAKLRRPRRPLRLPRPMAEDVLDEVLAGAREPLRAWFLLAGFAGLRCCEIAPLRGEDLRGGILRIREQKGGDEGIVPVAGVLLDVLRRYPQAGWWFPRPSGGPVTAGDVSKRSNAYLRALGIPDTMHALRHRFGTRVYLESGHDLVLTQQLMRHRSPVATVGYTRIAPGAAAAVVARL